MVAAAAAAPPSTAAATATTTKISCRKSNANDNSKSGTSSASDN